MKNNTDKIQIPLTDKLAYPLPDADEYHAEIAPHPETDDEVVLEVNGHPLFGVTLENWLAVCRASLALFEK